MSDARIGSLPNLAAAIGTLPIAKGGTGQITQQAAIDALLPSQTGNNGKALTTNGTTSSWGTISATAAYNFTSQTTTYSAAINDYILCSSSSFTITLPTAVGNSGKSIVIQHGGTSLTQVYTLNTTSAQTINGANGAIASGNYSLYTTGETLTLVSDGANWQVLEHQTDTPWVNAGAAYITATSAYVFTVTAANATVGAIYSNNGFNYTVSTTIAAGVTLTCSGTGTPAASGTLTKVSGTGDATITFSSRTITGAPALGTVATNNLFWRRSGTDVLYRLEYKQTAAGTAGSGDYIMTLPANLPFDGNFMTYYTPVAGRAQTNNLGLFSYGDNGNMFSGSVVAYNSSMVRFQFSNTGGSAFLGSAQIGLATVVVSYLATFSGPVSNWQP